MDVFKWCHMYCFIYVIVRVVIVGKVIKILSSNRLADICLRVKQIHDCLAETMAFFASDKAGIRAVRAKVLWF